MVGASRIHEMVVMSQTLEDSVGMADTSRIYEMVIMSQKQLPKGREAVTNRGASKTTSRKERAKTAYK